MQKTVCYTFGLVSQAVAFEMILNDKSILSRRDSIMVHIASEDATFADDIARDCGWSV